jgi:hypothetical protein
MGPDVSRLADDIGGQVVDLAAGAVSARRRRIAPNALPVQLTSFVGRERELAEILDALMETRLLTLTGSGGRPAPRVRRPCRTRRSDHAGSGVPVRSPATRACTSNSVRSTLPSERPASS